MVGRDEQLTELRGLVREHRLVTLTGAGGVGKTRLAVEVAANLADEFPDGVWLVELAPVGDPASVPDAVATALGITPKAGREITEDIVESVSGQRSLIVLDNCEHVLRAAADVAEALVTRAHTVQVVATEPREPAPGSRTRMAGPAARRRGRIHVAGGRAVRTTGPLGEPHVRPRPIPPTPRP